ncbi:acyl-CoA dehydrogenase [Salinibacter ruber]|uniref:Acyl-coenzyme A dehydrogenase n=1 Tax=Salinibacter ruber TaxID=146919 RepID=A0A9X2U1W9_9BACT|nr:acyl-CoA dehydrogenase [Salinibacter ruber]MCS3858858.1 acyl-CoA dehydrogenase [Salinibacter ruber]MCS3865738.1 acyl-CoA dehydrogenase [Salinibacter ruber]MCS4149624.1 acyl-CoA dehydrogenase [Salinibacter ruber]MCS4175974.1 acyl-CoA dehydrogenase [Salinibacter ruber]
MTLPSFDFFAGMPTVGIVGGMLLVLAVLGYTGAPLWAWALAGAVGLYGGGAPLWVWIPYGGLVAVFNIGPIRRQVSAGVMGLMEVLQFLPTISETEQTAIDAGTVWMEGELFSGKPDFEKTLDQLYPELSDDEQAFLDGPCKEVCAMVDDWQVHQRGDLSAETWDYLKEKGFFGLIIPEAYGGKGFSVAARSAVVQKLGGHSVPLSITVMVPNSLGPGELLLHYGTDEQQDHYLPRLARGEILPSFALTEPNAGSDAGAMESTGEVFEDEDGELKLRLNWEKRYISLAAISGVLGLAFKLHDPENHLGKGADLGITCALVPTDTPGVELGRRHDPLGVAFFNCPTEGEDVVLPLDAIIGGRDGAGEGWAMLMDALSAGRGIMLPAQAVGGGKMVTRVAGGHAAIREQFGLSIGKFEGIEEPLARIAGYTYIMDAARTYTNGAVDQGEKPGVVSAIMKYNTTELQRDLVNDGMDVLAGNGISQGPNNLMGLAYQAQPISITVEGANILTRTMMIFGQGAIRCHPYALDEIEALMEGDVDAFDDAFWSHIGHVVRNGFRALGLSLTRGRLASSPVRGPAAPYYRKMAWASASFAFFADLAMGSLGGMLKRKEKITGRFADILSWMYLGTAVLTRFEKEGRPEEQEAFLHWSMQHAFAQMQEAFDGLFENLKVPGGTWLLRGLVAPWSRLNTIGERPGDDLGGTLARAIQEKAGAREWLTEDLYVPDDPDQPLGELERAFRLSREAYHVGQKIKAAIRAGDLPKRRPHQLLEEAVEHGVITEEDRALVRRADAARERYIQVDAFDLEEYRQGRMLPGQPADRGALDSSIVEGLERDVTDVEVTPEDVDGGAPHPRGDGAPDATDEDDPEADRSGTREPA